MNNLPLVLLILDGLGLAPSGPGNAVSLASTPNFDKLWRDFPHSELEASGLAVGLPAGQMGNSEVGHSNIGAGRIIKQDLVKIDASIDGGDFFDNPVLLQAIEQAKERQSKLHLIGLVSDGGVHSQIKHIVALLEASKRQNFQNVFVHALTDGRDTAPKSALDYIQQLDLAMLKIGVGKIATIAGRYYAMDRDKRWDRLEKAYVAMVESIGEEANSAEEAIEHNYSNGITDEFIIPTVIDKTGSISQGDVVICFNFRADRMIQLVNVLSNPSQAEFEITHPADNLSVFTMTHYSDDIEAPVLFSEAVLKRTLGEIIAANGLRQHRIAETEKYAHVTYFFNGAIEQQFKNEERVLIPSPKVATYDIQPEMSVDDVASATINTLKNGLSDVLIVNFANCDMVGHTGDITAAIRAVEAVDKALGRVYEAVQEANGMLLVTADHGNAEVMLEPNGTPCTTHTTNPVPFILCSRQDITLSDGKLSDIAPTILSLIGIKSPDEMTGSKLIQ